MRRPVKLARFSVRAFWGLASWLLPLSVVFVLTPVLLRALGAQSFGVLMVVLVLPAVVSQLDLGLASIAVRDLAGRIAQAPVDAKLTLFTYALAFAAIAASVAVTIAIAAPWFARTLGFSAVMGAQEATELVLWCDLWAALGLATALPSLLARAAQALALLAAVQTASTVALWIGALVLIRSGHSLRDIVLLGISITVLATFAMSLAMLHAVHWRGKWCFSGAVIARETRFASGMFAAQVAGTIVYQIDRMLVASLGSPAMAGAYSLCVNLANKPMAAVVAISSFMFPHASGLHVKGEREQLAALVHAMDRAVCVLVIPLIFPGLLLASAFLSLWLGAFATTDVKACFQLLWLAFALPAFSIPVGHALAASGRSAPAARFAWLTAVTLALAMVMLVPRYGLRGAACAVLLGMSTSIVFSISARAKLALGKPHHRARFWIGICLGCLAQLTVLLGTVRFATTWGALLGTGVFAWASFFAVRAIFQTLCAEELQLLQLALGRTRPS